MSVSGRVGTVGYMGECVRGRVGTVGYMGDVSGVEWGLWDIWVSVSGRVGTGIYG